MIRPVRNFFRSALRLMMFKSPMSITPLRMALREGSHGSNLNGNYPSIRLTSAWKSRATL